MVVVVVVGEYRPLVVVVVVMGKGQSISPPSALRPKTYIFYAMQYSLTFLPRARARSTFSGPSFFFPSLPHSARNVNTVPNIHYKMKVYFFLSLTR